MFVWNVWDHLMWHNRWFSLSDCNTEGNSADEDTMALCGDGQPDFRSILSYGVQEPWVELLAPSVSLKYLCFLFWPFCCSLFVLAVCRRKFSDSIAEMLVVCATTVHRVGLHTAPNELCPRVTLMAWNTCAFTIQAIGKIQLFNISSSYNPFFSFWLPKLHLYVSTENILQEEEKSLFGSLQNRQVWYHLLTTELKNSVTYQKTIIMVVTFSSILACRSKGNSSVFSITETQELSGCNPKVLHRDAGR